LKGGESERSLRSGETGESERILGSGVSERATPGAGTLKAGESESDSKPKKALEKAFVNALTM